VAFDRLLARLFSKSPSPWALKGGYAMEIWMKETRTTKDIDLAFRGKGELRAAEKEALGIADPIRMAFQDFASSDLGDHFHFFVGEAMGEIAGAPFGGSRYAVEARMDGRTFEKYHVDVAFNERLLEPLEEVRAPDRLRFAGIEPPTITLISKEQQFAEKLHAYTFPRHPFPNSRVKDLVDMALLIDRETLNMTKLREAIRITFNRPGSHDPPILLPRPPKEWEKIFSALAQECSLGKTVAEAFQAVALLYKKLTFTKSGKSR